MIKYRILGTNPIQEVTRRCMYYNVEVGAKVVATDGRNIYPYVWLGDRVRYIVKGE